MNNYLVLVRGGAEGYAALSEDEMKGLYEKWALHGSEMRPQPYAPI
jgi:hypothetical protein